MRDLQTLSGLPLALSDENQLVFGPGVMIDEANVRLFDALTPVALDPASCQGRQDIAYYMYNGVYLAGDQARLAGLPVRYELTLIQPGHMGPEFVKTFGHIHSSEPQSGLAYAEVCEVLVGTAHFIFQTLDPVDRRADRAFYVEAQAGQKVIVPPNLDHCTINPAAEPLIFSDVIALEVRGIYDRFRALRGAAYLEIDDPEARFIPNPGYRAVAPLEKVLPKDYLALHLSREVPLYTAFVTGRGQDWPFLIDPTLFAQTFPDLPF